MRPIKAIDGYEPFDENFTANRFDYQYSVHRNFMLWRLKLLDMKLFYIEMDFVTERVNSPLTKLTIF